METYKVVSDEDELRGFVETMMPDLQDDWVYVVWVVARKKWMVEGATISASEEMLDRDLLTYEDPERILRRLRRFEVPVGSFVDKNTGAPIPPEVTGYYIDLTPKAMSKGLAGFMKDTVDNIVEARSDKVRLRNLRKARGLLFSHVHRANAMRKSWVLVDVDTKEPDVLDGTLDVLEDKGIPHDWITETRGGYHVFVPSGEHLATFFKEVRPGLDERIEVLDHNQTPIVGTLQGGFPVRRLVR